MLHFDATRAAAPTTDAATVLVLREGLGSLQVFCVLRHPKSGFLGGALVFPGGKLDDSDLHCPLRAQPLHARVPELSSPGACDPAALVVTGVRETLEEAGLLPADCGDATIERIRAELETVGLHEALLHGKVRLDLTRMVPFGRWVTPIAEARRFDARFFLMRASSEQSGRHDGTETTSGLWASPTELLNRYADGSVAMAPPTLHTLELLRDAQDFEAANRIASEQTLRPICPLFVESISGLVLPGDRLHPERDRRIAGPTRWLVRDERFVGVSEDAD